MHDSMRSDTSADFWSGSAVEGGEAEGPQQDLSRYAPGLIAFYLVSFIVECALPKVPDEVRRIGPPDREEQPESNCTESQNA